MQKRAVARSREHTKEIKKKKKAQLLKLPLWITTDTPPPFSNTHVTAEGRDSERERCLKTSKLVRDSKFRVSSPWVLLQFVSQCSACVCVWDCVHPVISVWVFAERAKIVQVACTSSTSLRMLKVVTENRNIETWQAVIHIGTLPAQLSSR